MTGKIAVGLLYKNGNLIAVFDSLDKAQKSADYLNAKRWFHRYTAHRVIVKTDAVTSS